MQLQILNTKQCSLITLPPPPPLPPSPLPVPCLPSMQPTLKQEPGLGGEVMTDTVLRSRASTGVSVMLNMLGFVEQTTTTVS